MRLFANKKKYSKNVLKIAKKSTEVLIYIIWKILIAIAKLNKIHYNVVELKKKVKKHFEQQQQN